MTTHRQDRVGPEGRDEDPLVREWLGALDPGATESRYWDRFHDRVLARTRGELARRRAAAEVTVLELVGSWSRAVVPAALAAAAVAAFLLLQPATEGPELPGHAGVEELLAEGLEGDPVPEQPFLDGPGSGTLAVFAGEIF